MEHRPGGMVAIAICIPVDPVSNSDTPASRFIAPELISISRFSGFVIIILFSVMCS